MAALLDAFHEVDYFQVLRLGYDASPGDIKKAFYRESRIYHPDRFFHLSDQQVKGDIGHVYKRITEAYYFLRDDDKRKKYLGDIASADRKAKLRFTEASEAETREQKKKEQEEQIGMHPKGRQFYATGVSELERSNFGAAERALKMALTYEPSNAKYKEKLLEVQSKMTDDFKKAGDKFKIR